MIKNIQEYWDYINYKSSVLLKSKTKGTLLGNAWFVLNPLFQIFVYYFFTEIVFKASNVHGKSSFLIIIVGIFHYNFLSQLLAEAPLCIRAEESILLQMPIQSIAFVASFFYRVIKESIPFFVLCLLFYVFLIKDIPSQILFYPFIFGIMLLFFWAMTMIAAVLGVFYLDTGPIIQLALKILIFLCPVVYPLSILPEKVQIILSYNPLTFLFTLFQWSLLDFPLPSISAIIVNSFIMSGLFIVSQKMYKNLSPEFTKVL